MCLDAATDRQSTRNCQIWSFGYVAWRLCRCLCADHTLPCSASVPTPESCLYLQIWYEAAKKAVLTIGERTLSSAVTRRTDSLEGDPEIEALLDTLW